MKGPRRSDRPRPILGIRFERPPAPPGRRIRREPDRMIVYLPDDAAETEDWLDDGLPLLETPPPTIH
jgi:hypothetical protein